ncbi:hypothetical protein BJY00DRAFT_165548 [Aspergillus carlsbadensis]|nr:hypothetical protein BJY00DRAFT_165548 [Aspergillus carlsbadensis]
MRGIRIPRCFSKIPFRLLSSQSPVMSRDYGAAIAALNLLQSNFSLVQEFNKPATRHELNQRSLPETVEWLRRIGYQLPFQSPV